jgi:hypothetical protein
MEGARVLAGRRRLCRESPLQPVRASSDSQPRRWAGHLRVSGVLESACLRSALVEQFSQAVDLLSQWLHHLPA